MLYMNLHFKSCIYIYTTKMTTVDTNDDISVLATHNNIIIPNTHKVTVACKLNIFENEDTGK